MISRIFIVLLGALIHHNSARCFTPNQVLGKPSAALFPEFYKRMQAFHKQHFLEENQPLLPVQIERLIEDSFKSYSGWGFEEDGVFQHHFYWEHRYLDHKLDRIRFYFSFVDNEKKQRGVQAWRENLGESGVGVKIPLDFLQGMIFDLPFNDIQFRFRPPDHNDDKWNDFIKAVRFRPQIPNGISNEKWLAVDLRFIGKNGNTKWEATAIRFKNDDPKIIKEHLRVPFSHQLSHLSWLKIVGRSQLSAAIHVNAVSLLYFPKSTWRSCQLIIKSFQIACLSFHYETENHFSVLIP